MTKRFFGEWPKGVRIVRFEPSPYAAKDSVADALTRTGSSEKPLSPLTDETQNGPPRKYSERSGTGQHRAGK